MLFAACWDTKDVSELTISTLQDICNSITQSLQALSDLPSTSIILHTAICDPTRVDLTSEWISTDLSPWKHSMRAASTISIKISNIIINSELCCIAGTHVL
jgi:hypothetical protein